MTHQKLTNKVERDSNIELLRILLMIMVVLHHLIIRSGSTGGNNAFILNIINTPLLITVNCYMFISGYFGIKFKLKGLISFLIQGIFYSGGVYIIYHIILSDNSFSTIELFKSFLPITYPVWWFFSAYIGVYLLAPFINKGIESLKPYQSGGIIIALIYICCSYPLTGSNPYTGGGSGVFTMLLIYIIARFCGTYIPHIKKATILYLLICAMTIISVTYSVKLGKEDLAWRLISHNSLLIVFGALFFFYIFKKIKFKNKIINKIAPLSFGVYLIHEAPGNKELLANISRQTAESIGNPFLLLLTLSGIAISIFIICAVIEKIRQLICTPIVNTIDDKTMGLQLKLKTLLNNLTTH